MRSEFSTPTKGLCFGSKLLFAEDVEFIRFRRIGFFQKARSVTSQPKHVHSIISQKLNLPLSFGNLTRMFGKGLCLAVIFGAVSVSSRRILQVQRRDEAIQIVKAPELCSSCRSSGATHGRLGSRNKFNTDKICSDAALPRTVVSCGEVVRDNNNNLLCGVVWCLEPTFLIQKTPSLCHLSLSTKKSVWSRIYCVPEQVEPPSQ